MQLGQKNSLIQRVAWMLVDISMLPFFILRRENRMPKTKKQGIIFGLIMSYAMAYGMEVYNTAIKDGFFFMCFKACKADNDTMYMGF